MRRFLFSLGLFCLFVLPALADESKKPEPPVGPPQPTATDRLRADPNDVKALNSLLRERLLPINEMMEDDKLDAAEGKLGELKTELGVLAPSDAPARQRLDSLQATVTSFLDEIELQRTKLADLEKRLDADADDIAAVVKYPRKIRQQVRKIETDEPARAQEMIRDARHKLERVQAEANDAPVKRQVTA